MEDEFNGYALKDDSETYTVTLRSDAKQRNKQMISGLHLCVGGKISLLTDRLAFKDCLYGRLGLVHSTVQRVVNSATTWVCLLLSMAFALRGVLFAAACPQRLETKPLVPVRNGVHVQLNSLTRMPCRAAR